MLRASADAVWEPDFAKVARTDDFTMVKYPAWFQFRTGVYRISSDKTPQELVDLVAAQARRWDSDTVWFQGISDATRPSSLEAHLTKVGGEMVERVAILALDLTAPLPALDVPADAVSAQVLTAQQVADSDLVSDEAFENDEPNNEPLADRAAAWQTQVADGTGVAYVTHLDGRPAGAGGSTYYTDSGIALLWGGSTARWARGRGAYRSNLAARLADAKARGLRIALVKGRVATSGPILRRAGFISYGEERAYRLNLDVLAPSARI